MVTIKKDKRPKITIITPSFNQGHLIEETICSIINQNYSNLEYIIIDGGSTDQTVDIIRKYDVFINYWVSEKDLGQADAINKGISKASGDIIHWINSDDLLMPGTLHKIAKLYSEGIDCYCGSVLNFNGLGEQNIVYNTNLNFQSILTGTFSWHQPGVWFSAKCLKKITLRTELHYAFDYKMMLDIFKDELSVVYCGDVFVKFRLHSESKTVSQNGHFCNEYISILKEYREGSNSVLLKSGVDNHIHFFERIKYNYNIIDSICATEISGFLKRKRIAQNLLKYFRYNFNRYTLSKFIHLK